MKSWLCDTCKKRRIKEDIGWKSEEEKKTCFTCRFVRDSVNIMIFTMKEQAMERGLILEFTYKLTAKNKSAN